MRFDGTEPYEVSDFRQVRTPLAAVAVLYAVPGGISAYSLSNLEHLFALDPDANLEIDGDTVTLYDGDGMVVFTPLDPDSELLDLLPYEYDELPGECFS